MNKTRTVFLSAATVATAIAFLADNICPGTLNGLNTYLLCTMYIVVMFVIVKAKDE